MNEKTMKKYVLVTTVGKTDPIRSEHDGPLLHIVRHYRPEKVFLILTEEIEADERQYHHNEGAIHLLDPDCEVECIYTGIRDAHSYDSLSDKFVNICSKIKRSYPDGNILLNISSGTPQMETVMCMIAIAEPKYYIPVQVFSPQKRSNNTAIFDPKKDSLEEWFECNLDNLESDEGGEMDPEDSQNRCYVPGLLNFRKPIIQFQIESLIKNYDYAGAFQLYTENREFFTKESGTLLKHAMKRLNLEYEAANSLARESGEYADLYPVARADINRLLDFYNSIRIKQLRGELNDFALRLEIMAAQLGIYILEKHMNISIGSIASGRGQKNSTVMFLSQEKCKRCIPGLEEYLDEQFSDTKQGRFEWGRAVNALSIAYIVTYMCSKDRYIKYKNCAEELRAWAKLSGEVRNPAAHTIVAITDEDIRRSYSKGSAALCKNMKTILQQVFGNEAKGEAFEVYETINHKCKSLLKINKLLE